MVSDSLLGGEVGDGDQAVPVAALAGGALGGELVGVDPGRDDPDVPTGDAEAGQVRLLVVAAGDDRVDGAADRGLEPDPLGAGPGRDQPVAALGDAELVERLHHRQAEVAGGRQGGQAAGPAHRVDHVGAVLGPRLVQRGAERADLPDQLGVVAAGGGRADVLDADAGGQAGPLRQRPAVAARVDGHLVALAGQALAHLDQAGVVARGGGVGGGGAGDRGAVLGYQGDLHVGDASPRKRGAIFGELSAPEPSSEERGDCGRASTHAKMAWTCLRRRHHGCQYRPRRGGLNTPTREIFRRDDARPW